MTDRVRLGLIALALVWCAVRFVGLDASPAGYFVDETKGAQQILCLAETGHTDDGVRLPLFAHTTFDGFYTAPYLYSGVVWATLFGSSMAAFRALVAFFVVATILGLGLIAHRLGGASLALWVVVAAAVSPWSFQFSRIAWDPPLAPAFVVWGSYALLRGPRPLAMALSGVAFALAAFAYPPSRVQVALWVPVLLLVQWRRGALDRRGLLAFGGAFALAVSPLVVKTLNGELGQRASHSLIFAEWFTQRYQGNTPKLLFWLESFLENLHSFTRPSYLFFTGDVSLRHSTQWIGELSPLDASAVAIGAAWAIVVLLRRSTVDARLALLVLGGAVIGVVPAALIWVVPHALHSIGAWPFVVFFTGVVTQVWTSRRRWGAPLLLAVLTVYSVGFLRNYFGAYRQIDPVWFHREIKEALERDPRLQAREALLPLVGHYPDDQFRYYLMAHDGLGCDASARAVSEMRARGH
jgi:hypothetical protein